jgi:DNA-cytosine methyltransferase
MNAVSLFDGMSCAQLSLNALGKKIDNYYSAEIDRHSIMVTEHNFGNTINLGDVKLIDEKTIKEISPIHLIMGGFPCQDLSLAGKREGLSGSRSGLFVEFVRILKLVKKYNKEVIFLVENVSGMNKEDLKIINQELKCEGVRINSADFSPQRRKRWYWTNINLSKFPPVNKLVLNDVLSSVAVSTHYNIKKELIDTYSQLNDGEHWKHLPINNLERLKIEESRKKHKNPGGQTGFWKLYSKKEKSPTLTATGLKQKMTRFVFCDHFGQYRYPTPEECEILQGVPIGYTSIASDNQRYKMLGNGWNISTIKYLLKNL